MITFKIIRKIGKMLRGGAGKKEIFTGALLGVLIGFNPTLSLTLFLAILITLLLNANIGFTMLGVALGKVLGLALSVVTFHTGYFIIHGMGLESLFTTWVNAPVLALMDLNVYSMIGSLPFALVTGIAFGKNTFLIYRGGSFDGKDDDRGGRDLKPEGKKCCLYLLLHRPGLYFCSEGR